MEHNQSMSIALQTQYRKIVSGRGPAVKKTTDWKVIDCVNVKNWKGSGTKVRQLLIIEMKRLHDKTLIIIGRKLRKYYEGMGSFLR